MWGSSTRKSIFKKRFQNKRAFITGARLELKYQVGLKLLRLGADFAISSQNPDSALANYQQEPDNKFESDMPIIYRPKFKKTQEYTVEVDDKLWQLVSEIGTK